MIFCDQGAKVLAVGHFVLVEFLEASDSSQQKLHIDLFIGLFPSNFDLFAILPTQVDAENVGQPVIQNILEVHEKVEVFLFRPVLFFEGEGFTHKQFISVLIEGHQEKGEKGKDQAKQPSNV